MFEEFSKTYQNVFTTIFIIWLVGWSLKDFFTLIYSYSSIYNSNVLIPATTIFNVILTIITLVLGVTLLSLMISSNKNVTKNKLVKSIGLMSILAPCYYLMYTVFNSIISAITNSGTTSIQAQNQMIFNLLWLIPSIVMLIAHYLYIYNTKLYNKSLSPKTTYGSAEYK